MHKQRNQKNIVPPLVMVDKGIKTDQHEKFEKVETIELYSDRL